MASSPDIFQWLGESYTVSTGTSENIWKNTSWTHQEQNTSNYADFSILVQYNKSSVPNFINLLNDKALEEHTTITSAAHLGLSTGLLLTILLNSRLDAIKAKSFLVCFETMVLQFLFAAICLVLTLAAAPILGVFTVLLMCYRQGVHLFLKATKPRYVSLLDGLDAVWAIEEETNKSVINVLALIQVENIDQGRNLLESFRKMVIDRFTKSPLPCPKIFYFRRKCLGYFYWERQTELRIKDYIRSMTVVHEQSATNNENNVTSEISEETLNTLIAEVCNSKLPANHAACWEILVGSQSIKKSLSQTADVFQALEEGIPEEPSTSSLLYPILFRVHHSLGDGITLMHLLVSAMADILTCAEEEIPTPLSMPPPMPIPNRKFPSNSNSSLKTVISGTNNTCCESNENTACFRHEAQSPNIEVNHIGLTISPDNCQKLRKHIENCKTLKETLTRTDAEKKLADSEVSLNVQSDKENDIQFIDNITESICQISEGNESITYIPLKQQNSCIAMNKEERSPDSYRRRPLLLTNHNSNPCQQSTEYPGLNSSQYQLCYTKTLQDEQSIISKHYPSSDFKNIIKDSKFEPGYKLTGSYNQSLNRELISNDFSQAFTSNLHNSLPVLTNHQHSSLNKKALQKQSPDSNTNTVKSECFSTNSLASFQEFPFMGSITKCIQDSTCSSTKSRVYLEELQTSSSKLERPTTIHPPQTIKSQKRPPVCLLFEKDHHISKSASKSTQDIPYFNGDHCKTTKLHCYNKSTSDSYITVPEDLAFSSEPVVPTSDKGTNTSTTIYYYNNSTAFTADVSSQPLQETNNCVADSVNKTEYIPCNNTSNHVSNRHVDEKRNSWSERSNDNFERNNCTTATQTSPRVPSPSLLSDAVHLQRPTDNTQLDLTEWNIVDMQITTELGTITEEELSDKKEHIPSDSHYLSHATTYPDPGKSFVKNINSTHDSKGITDIKLCQETENINHFIDNCNATTCTASENADEPRLTYTNGRFKFDKLKKIWSNVTSDENNGENIQTLSSHSPLHNQYVELLNTISNSNFSLSKYDRWSNLIQKAYALALAPASLIHQALMREADVNSLHGPPLSGQKVIAWHQDPTGDLLKCIKRVKKNSNIRFTEVILTALSASLETYFETHKTANIDKIPEVVTVVVPARMEYLSTKQIRNVNLTPEIKIEKVGNSDVTVPFILQENSDISRHSASDRLDKHCAEFKATHLENEDIPLPKYTGTGSKTSEDEMRDWVNSNEIREEHIIQLPSQECDDMSQDKTVLLNNRFSLALLTLPITSATVNMKEGGGNAYKTLSPRRRLNEVHHYSELLRKGLDYQVNYWLLRVAATVLPASLLEAVIRSSQSSLVVSNIMGPTQELSLAGNRLRTMMFWVPNRDTTGIGVTVLSYQGRLQIGIIADKALITSKQDAQMILDEMVLELYKLDAVISE